MILSQAFDEDLTILSSDPEGEYGIAYADYFIPGDQCFNNMMHEGTGPYADYMASILQ